MILLVVIRPEPGCATTVAAARAMGLEAQGFPLFVVRPLDWEAPPAAGFDALLVGSANVFRQAGPALSAYCSLPVHAVGQTTADAARQAGFTVAATGSGGLQPVLDRVEAGTRLLRLAGAERITLRAPQGVTLTERAVYESAPLPMPEALAQRLTHPAVIALHSAEAARHFRAECARLGIAPGQLALATIGPRVRAAAGSGWQQVTDAGTPEDTALLASAKDLCHILAGEQRNDG